MSTTRIKFQFFGFWDVIFALKKVPPEVVVSIGSGTIQVFDGLLLGSIRASWLIQAALVITSLNIRPVSKLAGLIRTKQKPVELKNEANVEVPKAAVP